MIIFYSSSVNLNIKVVKQWGLVGGKVNAKGWVEDWQGFHKLYLVNFVFIVESRRADSHF